MDKVSKAYPSSGKRNEQGGSGSGDIERKTERERNLWNLVNQKKEYDEYFLDKKENKAARIEAKVEAGSVLRAAANSVATAGSKRKRSFGSSVDEDLPEEEDVVSTKDKKLKPMLDEIKSIKEAMATDAQQHKEYLEEQKKNRDAAQQQFQEQQAAELAAANRSEQRHEELMKSVLAQTSPANQAAAIAQAVAQALSAVLPGIMASIAKHP
jgi:hypothetical protein